LTVLKEIIQILPEYDYLYLGDNARAPYGSRSFETVYQYTLECVKALFDQGCGLVVLACNTASAKALRSIQQKDLPLLAPERRVLGVIRPTAEVAGGLSKSREIGILATQGTVSSGSYVTEIGNFFPDVKVFQEACPMWVPLIESNEINNSGADFFIDKHVNALMEQSSAIDTVILGCTHYPLIEDKIKRKLPAHVKVVSQGSIVAQSLKDYLNRHPEIDAFCEKNGKREFYTTDQPSSFDEPASRFFGEKISSKHMEI
jgi:glutamate racemase